MAMIYPLRTIGSSWFLRIRAGKEILPNISIITSRCSDEMDDVNINSSDQFID